MFHSNIFCIIATFLLSTSGQRSFSSCRRYICFLEPMVLVSKEPYIFKPNHVDPKLCSHMLLSALRLDGNKLDIPYWQAEKRLTNMHKQMKQFKLENPKLKIMLTVSDDYPNSKMFSTMAATASGRREFINSLIPFLREHGFDGVDLDWFFPAYFGGVKSDKETFAALIKEIATEFDKESLSGDRTKLLLSAWAPRAYWLVEKGYNVTEFARYVDFINLLTSAYNLHVNYPINHWSPLNSNDVNNIDCNFSLLSFHFSKKESVHYWVERGMPKIKINIAIVAFSFRVYAKPSSDIKIGESVMIGTAKTDGRGPGYLTYYQTCSLMNQGGKVYWDSWASAPYHIQDNYFMSFENEEGIKNKVRFLREHKFGGVVFRGPQEDDYLGLECGKGAYPLLRTIKEQCTIRMN